MYKPPIWTTACYLGYVKWKDFVSVAALRVYFILSHWPNHMPSVSTDTNRCVSVPCDVLYYINGQCSAKYALHHLRMHSSQKMKALICCESTHSNDVVTLVGRANKLYKLCVYACKLCMRVLSVCINNARTQRASAKWNDVMHLKCDCMHLKWKYSM